MAVGGLALRLSSTVLRAIQFGCCAVGLGIYAYFLAALADHDLPIETRWRAVTGITGSGCLYTLFGVILTCFLGGITFFGFLAVVLDIAFAGAFVGVAYMTRDGADSCRGFVQTPLGSGDAATNAPAYGPGGFGTDASENVTYIPRYGTACRLNTAVFATAIIAIFLFFVTAALQVFLVRRHKADKKYGPSPSNGYTSGRNKFWKRNKKTHLNRDAEAATALPATRPSGETGTTVGANAYTEPKYGQPGYGQATNY